MPLIRQVENLLVIPRLAAQHVNDLEDFQRAGGGEESGSGQVKAVLVADSFFQGAIV